MVDNSIGRMKNVDTVNSDGEPFKDFNDKTAHRSMHAKGLLSLP